MNERPGFGTLAIHGGQRPDPTTGAVITPVYQTSTYAQSSPGVFKGPYDYSRSANPTRTALEANLAALEGGRFGLSFSSGVAAMANVLHLLQPGDHLLLGDDVYGGTFRLVDKVYAKLGITYSICDFTDLDAVRHGLTDKTRLVWLETPTNPMLKVCDIAAVCDIANKANAITCVDNTFASPYLQNPLALGADIVSHSVTKYIGGHADVVGGALITSSEELHDKLKFTQNAAGAVPGPWDCALLLRSTKTLHVRMERHCDNAEKVAAFLDNHPRIDKVIYPGLPSHPQHAIAAKQMKRFGGMISAVLKGSLDDAKTFLENLRLFTLAESLGGVESLVEHPAIMTHASIPADQRAKLGIVDGFVRFSVGIEDVNDQIADLEQALG
ncbi:MAG: cystathionine gamma-synthase [Phycisphaerales bacterium JB037]